MADRNGDIGSFMAGFILGGLVGAVTALLLAPQSGEDTRAYIKDKSIELKDRAVETAEEARTRAEEAASEARARVDEVTKQAKQTVEDIRKRGEEMLEEQRQKFESAVEAGKQAAKQKKEQLGGEKSSS